MNALTRLMSGAAIALVLGALPAYADKISASGKNPPLTTTEQTPPPSSTAGIDFGDDSGDWTNDGECDDPRFTGTGSAAELLEADIRKDATDCRTAFEAGTVTLKDTGDTPSTTDIDFGDDSGDWANDDECDDPRFRGTGSAEELVDADLLKDATDCKAAFEAGTVTLNPDYQPQAVTPVAFDYGADWSKWANDNECDDLRFEGTGVDKKLLIDDLNGDATDCRAAVEAGTATIRKVYSPEYAAGAPYDSSAIDFGDNTSDYADDQSCDDPRFEGPGAASVLLESDLKHDSADCEAAYEAGTIMLIENAEG